MRLLAVILLRDVVLASACSFLVANYNLSSHHTAVQISFANEVQKLRGPDATNLDFAEGWSFLHNLLSMTGELTLQPFISRGRSGPVVALFNGEIYNYRELALELTGSPDTFLSDGPVLLPAYKRWGTNFVRRLHGEFSLVLIDFVVRKVIISADVFGTKPLWWATWQESGMGAVGKETGWRFLAASYESALIRLGAPAEARRMAEPNQALVLGFSRLGRVSLRKTVELRLWDLRQYKNSTADWVSAFRRAVGMRTRGVKHRLFIGLSSGYDSGAIMLALKLQRMPVLAYAIRGVEDLSVVRERARLCKGLATVTLVRLDHRSFREAHEWLRQKCEVYAYRFEARRGELLTDDEAATGMSMILTKVRQKGGLIYLSGSGSDEIISDYAMNGRAIYPHSCFRGIFPVDLSRDSFFPWCSFYHGSQRAFLMKEELTSGAHGIEGRYPFLDPDVVQEFLWLSPRLKNSEYKRPVADFLRAHQFPNAWKVKLGFKARENLDSSVPAEVLTDPMLDHLAPGQPISRPTHARRYAT